MRIEVVVGALGWLLSVCSPTTDDHSCSSGCSVLSFQVTSRVFLFSNSIPYDPCLLQSLPVELRLRARRGYLGTFFFFHV